MVGPDEILRFWLDECSPKQWFVQDDEFDQIIRDRFLETWVAATKGEYALWLTYPNGALAYIILTDQFPRNMFRDSGAAFSTDRAALAVAKSAIAKGWDMRIDPPARQFMYMPLEHSENLSDQDRVVRLTCERMQDDSFLLHAQAHREVIRLFGRFPHRNVVMNRTSTASEQAYLDAGGYGAVLRGLQRNAA
ncbi:MAG: DUF924 family protein [Tateyamaria sp.]|uniref:DUF924 family protein n=1 Tax=Tateyamaria sp. TaxID=1929288 RepID=UPI00327EF72E